MNLRLKVCKINVISRRWESLYSRRTALWTLSRTLWDFRAMVWHFVKSEINQPCFGGHWGSRNFTEVHVDFPYHQDKKHAIYIWGIISKYWYYGPRSWDQTHLGIPFSFSQNLRILPFFCGFKISKKCKNRTQKWNKVLSQKSFVISTFFAYWLIHSFFSQVGKL